MSKATEKLTYCEEIINAIQMKDAMAPRPGDKDEFGNDLYKGAESDAAASFDLELDKGQYPTIHWLIAKWILRDASEYIMVDKLGTVQGMVNRNLDRAVEQLIEGGVNVYKVMENGGKGRNISCLTLRPWYKNAEEVNGNRLVKRIESGVSSALRRAELTCPDRLNLMVDHAQAVAEAHRKNLMLESDEQGEAAGTFDALPADREMTQGQLTGSM